MSDRLWGRGDREIFLRPRIKSVRPALSALLTPAALSALLTPALVGHQHQHGDNEQSYQSKPRKAQCLVFL